MPGRLLIIAYYFPPLGGVGAQRPLKFAKYLPEFGWIPHILTVTDEPTYVHDPSLFRDVRPEIAIDRTGCLQFTDLATWLARLPGVERGMGWLARGRSITPQTAIRSRLTRYLGIPDSKVGWILPSYRRARALICSNQIDAVYTTSAPFSSHLIGYWLNRRTGIPWLADFRDEWAQNPYVNYPTIGHRWLNASMERTVLRSADHVIAVSEPLTELLRSGISNSAKFSTITNGFDRDDINLAHERQISRPDTRFRLAYAGTFYGLRTPNYLFQAIESLLASGEMPPDEIRLRLIGRMAKYSLSRPDWEQVLEFPGYLEHQETQAELLRSDGLLLLVPTEGNARTYPAKVFEYIALGKPILALVPPQSVVADLIRESRTGVVVAPEDADQIKSALLEFYQKWRAGQLAVEPDERVIQRYDRRNLTWQLAQTLNQITESNESPDARIRQ